MPKGPLPMADPFQIDEQPRAMRYPDGPRDPASLLLVHTRKHTESVNGMLAEVAYVQFFLAKALEQVRDAPADQTANEWQAVRIIAERLAKLLQDHHVDTEDPTGRPWSDAMREAGYEPIVVLQREGITAAQVARVDTPRVRRFGKTIRTGQVVVEVPADGSASREDQ